MRAPVLLCDCLGFVEDCCRIAAASMSKFTMALLWDCCVIAVKVVWYTCEVAVVLL